MAEVFAIDKTLDLMILQKWPQINICTDSLNLFHQSLENSQLTLFPIALNKLNHVVADLIYKINKINKINCYDYKVRFSWCPAHVEVKHNERVDLLADIGGELCNNNLTIKEIIISLKSDYIDKLC